MSKEKTVSQKQAIKKFEKSLKEEAEKKQFYKTGVWGLGNANQWLQPKRAAYKRLFKKEPTQAMMKKWLRWAYGTKLPPMKKKSSTTKFFNSIGKPAGQILKDTKIISKGLIPLADNALIPIKSIPGVDNVLQKQFNTVKQSGFGKRKSTKMKKYRANCKVLQF